VEDMAVNSSLLGGPRTGWQELHQKVMST
jgi:hypothetical protein